MRHWHIILYFAMFTIMACTQKISFNTSVAAEIETYITMHPDSALTRLLLVNKAEELPPKEKAYHALLRTIAEYTNNGSLNDSTLNIAYTYFITEEKGTESQKLQAILFEGIRLHKQKRMPDALKLLLEVEKQIELLPHDYLKGVTEYYLANIYKWDKQYSKMHAHFLKEWNYISHSNNPKWLTNGMNHLAKSYKLLSQPDSAYFCLKQALHYCEMADTIYQAVTYHNLGNTIRRFFPDKKQEATKFIEKSLQLRKTDEERFKCNLALATLYDELNLEKKSDSLWNIVLQTQDSIFRFIVCFDRYKHFENKHQPDSALKYYKESVFYKQKISEKHNTQQLAQIEAEYNYERVLKESAQKNIWILIITSIIIILLCLLIIWRLLIERRIQIKICYYENLLNEAKIKLQQIEKLEQRINLLKENEKLLETQNHSLLEEKTSVYAEKIQIEMKKSDLETRLAKAEQERSTFISQINEYTLLIDKLKQKKLNSILSANSIKRYSTCKDFAADMLTTIYLNDNNQISQYPQLKTSTIQLLIEGYTSLCPGFIQAINKYDLTSRDLFICILYHENICEDTIMQMLDIEKNNFQSTKCRIKKKLKNDIGDEPIEKWAIKQGKNLQFRQNKTKK